MSTVVPPTYLAALVLVFILVRLRRIASVSALLLQDVAYYLPPPASILESLNVPIAAKPKFQKPEKTIGERVQVMQFGMTPIRTGSLDKSLFFDVYDTLVLVTVAAVVVFAFMQFVPLGVADPSAYLLYGALAVALLFPFLIQYGMSSYEAKLGVGVALVSTIVALFSLFAPPGLLDVDVEGAAASMHNRWQLVLEAMGTSSSSSASSTLTPLWHALILGAVAGLISSTTFLPAFRFARMYTDFVSSKAIPASTKLLLHLNMALPLVVGLAYVRPLTTSWLVGANATRCHDDASSSWIAPRDCGAIGVVSESTWRNARLYVVVAAALVRLLCYRSHMQYFLLEAKPKATALLLVKGRVDTQAIVDAIVVPLQYLPVVCVQYLAPAVLWLASALLLQRKAHRCFGVFDFLFAVGAIPMIPSLQCAATTAAMLPAAPAFHWSGPDELSWTDLADLVQGLHAFPVAEPLWFESVLGFLVWWSATSWFVLSLVGLVYWRHAEKLQQNWSVGRRQTKVA
ncbi:Aste57867_9283 [Aphanomyces stellatus]|uniref:Aste57867_9283 protein n=1 Tax=Aphanomyces stellatus TaxID=120398 RepID=A0A485KMH3_9STRA|nr:hypothetical protein As57867_009247 [Aphanomyces stellatus]VFT86165.1 Aste57867_9283 [Aphanomyces stellatus]